jgi:histidine ammonia-lyase
MAIRLERHDQLDLPQYQRIAFEREALEVAPGLLSGVARSRAALLDHLESGAQAYGVNTGLGYLAGRVVEDVDQAAFQRSILAGRATGFGRPLSDAVVRGAMLLRLTGFLGGYAGVSPELCSLLVERLNNGWFPEVPGGVSGAAGEIVPLAHLFLALVDDAVPPYSLGAKEGIALINGAPLAPGPSGAGKNAEPEGLYPTGNFHAQALTLLLDYTAIALTQVLNLLEKRLHRLLDSRFSGLPDQLTPDPGRRSGLVTLHKQVIGLVAQARGLAAPATIDALDASTGQEDIQAHTLLAAGQLDGVLDALELALGYELVALRQARFLAGTPLPAPLEHSLSMVADIVPPVVEDRSLAGDVSRVREMVASGRLVGGVRCPSIWFSPTPA